MKQRRRIYYTEANKALMWDRWQRGDKLHAIAAGFDRYHSSVFGILVRTGEPSVELGHLCGELQTSATDTKSVS